MSSAAIQIRPAADANAPSRYHSRAAIPSDVEDRFLAALTEFGQVTYAANVSGMARRSLYERRRRDPDFGARWDEALEAFEETLTQRVIATALHMGTGQWVPAVDHETGEAELDDDFEPLMRFDCSNVDPRIAVKLMSLRMRDLNARTAPLVAVQNNSFGAAAEVIQGEPLDLDALKAEVIDAEVVDDD
ncbi:MAG: hypothetical protein AAF665_02260 [Pseudomonadota bacterium]